MKHDTQSYIIMMIGALLFGLPFSFLVISLGVEFFIGLIYVVTIALGIVFMSAGFHEFVIGETSP